MKPTLLLLLLATLLTFAAAAHADGLKPKQIAMRDRWGSYIINDNGNRVCYMAAKPAKQEGDLGGKKRDEVYALITHRPAEGTRNVFSYVAGYTYKSGSNVVLNIDGAKFTLFTKDDSAWAQDGADDNKIAQLLKNGKNMTVKGTSSHGTDTTDTFSLKGAGEAYKDIGRGCNVK